MRPPSGLYKFSRRDKLKVLRGECFGTDSDFLTVAVIYSVELVIHKVELLLFSVDIGTNNFIENLLGFVALCALDEKSLPFHANPGFGNITLGGPAWEQFLGDSKILIHGKSGEMARAHNIVELILIKTYVVPPEAAAPGFKPVVIIEGQSQVPQKVCLRGQESELFQCRRQVPLCHRHCSMVPPCLQESVLPDRSQRHKLLIHHAGNFNDRARH